MKKIILIITLLLYSCLGYAENEVIVEESKPTHLDTLVELLKSRQNLDDQIETHNRALKDTIPEDEKNRIQSKIETLFKKRNNIIDRFEKIATGVDTSIIDSKKDDPGGLSADFQLLIQPLIKGAKHATVEMRKKAELQDLIANYQKALPKVALAVGNLSNLRLENKRPQLDKRLKEIEQHWQQQLDLIASDLIASEQQLTIMKENETSLTESLQSGTKAFFKTRGRYFFEGILAFAGVILVSRLIYKLSVKLFPVIKQSNRSFKIRLMDLTYRIITFIAAILAPMTVFYLVEDWVLFSIGILVLFAIAWSLRTLLPQFWQQGRLLLNIGRVRENERLDYQGLPWLVKNINIFTRLENPVSGLRLRIPIEELAQFTSRPVQKNEPWFPCKKGDWVLLANDYFGRVVGISLEVIEMIDRGGAHRTFLTTAFLEQQPLNLSTGFRLRETIGISYQHQADSTRVITAQLKEFIQNKLLEDDYSSLSHRVQVELLEAAESSINLVVLADFTGEAAPLYRRLQRMIRRLCVEACTANQWNIPFPQLTIHQP